MPSEVSAQTCPGAKEVYTTSSGTIDYPEGDNKYENYLDCNIIIKAQAHQNIKFKFSEFEFEGNVAQGYDWLTIYEANNKKIGAYAMGDNEQPPTDWTKTDTNLLILHVKTDRSVRKKGFVMDWEFVVEDCGCNENGTRQDGCNKDTRACFCKENVEGNKCNKCKPKHWGFPGRVKALK